MVDGRTSELKKIIERSESPTLQLGNMGYRPAHDHYLDFRRQYSDYCIFGTRDFYPYLDHSPHSLGDYSLFPGTDDILCVRGGYSHDWLHKIPGDILDYDQYPAAGFWLEEQLNSTDFQTIIDSGVSPRVILSHEPPQEVARLMFDEPNNTRTGWGLQLLLKAFSPELWVFASAGVSDSVRVHETKFVSLGLLEVTDVV